MYNATSKQVPWNRVGKLLECGHNILTAHVHKMCSVHLPIGGIALLATAVDHLAIETVPLHEGTVVGELSLHLRFDDALERHCVIQPFDEANHRSHRYNLIGSQREAALATGCILTENLVHHRKQLFDALVLTEILTTFHKIRIVFFVITTDLETLRFANRAHHEDGRIKGRDLHVQLRDRLREAIVLSRKFHLRVWIEGHGTRKAIQPTAELHQGSAVSLAI
mmetsp:Transcript_7121/g.18029  ORF Transcript_7121/g.18029 Transcript_7121/m.18029 type:complete len:223 (-) Transcript_7121:567-1235(-)